MDGEIEQVQSGTVQFVDHEPHDPLVPLGYHADAIALPQAADKFFLGPWEFEAA
jgi:hypothetical protein